MSADEIKARDVKVLPVFVSLHEPYLCGFVGEGVAIGMVVVLRPVTVYAWAVYVERAMLARPDELAKDALIEAACALIAEYGGGGVVNVVEFPITPDTTRHIALATIAFKGAIPLSRHVGEA